MFTGLIREIGTITSVRPTATGRDVVVRCPVLAAEALTGDSIAANGVCLTVTALTADGYTCHAGIETLSRSTAGSWQPGRRVTADEHASKLYIEPHIKDCPAGESVQTHGLILFGTGPTHELLGHARMQQ